MSTAPKEDDSDLYKDQNDTWVDRSAPSWARPYLKMARVDRPIGTWLVVLPGWWGLALAASPGELPSLGLAAVFALGGFAMRGAGCTVNDMWDRDIDGKVARTRQRPLASGAMSMGQATAFLAAQLAVAAGCALPLGLETLGVCVSALGVVVLYPAMKRVTMMPQAVLGAAMNWGVLVGWSAVHGAATLGAAVPLWAAGACWTVVYDTLYAHQDVADDTRLGLGSSARLFGREWTRPALTAFVTGFAGLASYAVMSQGLAWPALAGVGLATAHMQRQVMTADFDDRLGLNDRFVSNSQVGGVVLAGLVAGRLLQEAGPAVLG